MGRMGLMGATRRRRAGWGAVFDGIGVGQGGMGERLVGDFFGRERGAEGTTGTVGNEKEVRGCRKYKNGDCPNPVRHTNCFSAIDDNIHAGSCIVQGDQRGGKLFLRSINDGDG